MKIMNEMILTYSLYLMLAIPITIWVARTLYKNGRIFLVECFHGKEELADSVNHLLVVGFYLVNLGFVSLYLKIGTPVTTVTEIFEALSTKMGVVLLVLGAMHFLNLFIFTKLRNRVDPVTTPPQIPRAAFDQAKRGATE